MPGLVMELDYRFLKVLPNTDFPFLRYLLAGEEYFMMVRSLESTGLVLDCLVLLLAKC